MEGLQSLRLLAGLLSDMSTCMCRFWLSGGLAKKRGLAVLLSDMTLVYVISF